MAIANAAVQVGTSATAIFTGMTSGHTLTVQNLGPDDVYVGVDNTVTSASGVQVVANGGVLVIDSLASGDIYGITTTLQVSPDDTRYLYI